MKRLLNMEAGQLAGLTWLFGMICAGLFPALQAGEYSHQAELQFRAKRELWMKSSASPLALAGLFWLKPGDNFLGTSPQNAILLPPGSAPGRLGSLRLEGKKVTFQKESPEAVVLLKNEPVEVRELRSDAGGQPADLLESGRLRMKIIQRGERLGLRLIDLKNPPLLSFMHLAFFEPSPRFRVEADFILYNPPKKIKIMSVIGVEEEMPCPGLVRFQLDGQPFTLEPVAEPGESLFFIFKDRTNGKETYGGGRFLNADPPRNNKVVLDFNQATNPYCAYSSFATCPMPPMQNWLKVAIPAGEKKYPLSGH
jgi:uncharacterized protein